MRLWIRDPLAILAEGAERGLVIEDGRIAALVPKGALPEGAIDDVFDASHHVVLPGLINAHHHFFQTLTRATPCALDKPLFPWLQSLYPVWANIDEEALAVAARVALAELMLSGCTLASDHHYLFPPQLRRAIDIEIEAASTLGIRVHLTRGSMSLSVKDGGLPPDGVVQTEDEILADCERLVGRYHDRSHGAMVRIALAPCSPFSVTRSLMEETVHLAEKLDVQLHTHLAETQDENAFCLETFGMRPLDYIEDCGWLTGRTWFAHGIHFTDDEIARIGKAGAGVCHCPSSNQVLASGICRVPALEAAGAAVGLGVDGSASSDCSNLIQEVRQAFLLQRLANGADVVRGTDALRWATEGSAACLGRDDVGRIANGYAADFALFKLDELRFAGAGDPIAALILCGAHKADRVMVGGHWTVVDGRIPGYDLAAIEARHRHNAGRLQKRGC